jgi:repressor LexA
LFALRVRGESMILAHICDGDLVLVRRQDSASANDIVVALVESESGEGEATVKRFAREGERVVLKPEHPTMAPIVVDPRRTPVQILGKVVAVLRGF